MRVMVRVDAGPTIGIGHAMRCSTLASALITAGHEVEVVARSLTPLMVDRFEQLGAKITSTLDRPAEFRQVLEHADPDVVVVDGYDLGTDLETAARSTPVLVVIDDNGELPVTLADIVVNQNLHAKDLDYDQTGRTKFLLGPEYALLRPDLLSVRRVQSSRNSPDVAVSSVLISFGGTDPRGLTLPTLRHLLGWPSPTIIYVALAPPHADYRVVNELIESSEGRAGFARPDLLDAYRSVDMAVIGAGATLWEVAYLGIPAVAVVVADNQVLGSGAASAAGFVTDVDCRIGIGSDRDLMDMIDRLAGDHELRLALSLKGERLFDGDGANRIVTEIDVALRSRPT